MIVTVECGDCRKCCHFPDGDCEALGEDGVCLIKDERRASSCDLYPFVVAVEDGELKIFVDRNCPNIPTVDMGALFKLIKMHHEAGTLDTYDAEALRGAFKQKLFELTII
jgi:hypothetical protein